MLWLRLPGSFFKVLGNERLQGLKPLLAVLRCLFCCILEQLEDMALALVTN